MKTIILALLILSAATINAQLIKHEKINKNIIVGFHFSGITYDRKDPITAEKSYVYDIYLEPYISYFFNKNIGIGVIGGYNSIRSNILPNDNYYELGGYIRTYLPYKLNKNKLNNFLFLSEVSYRKLNYTRPSSAEKIKSNSLEYSLLSIIPIGVEMKIWKGIHIELSPEWLIYSKNYDRLTYRLGIVYHFNKKQQ